MNQEQVQCQICKRYFKQITGKHLQIKHNITFEEYKKMFPDAETHPQWLRDKLVDANIEKWSDPKYKKRTAKTISDVNKIIMNDPEMTKKLKEGSVRRWSREDERERQRQIMLSYWEDEDYRKMQTEKIKKQWEDEDFRNAVIEAGRRQTGEKNPWYNSEIDVWIKENTNKHLCACGCNRYIIIKREDYHNGIQKFYCKECYYTTLSGEGNPRFGEKLTDDTKQLIREKAIKHWDNPEVRILQSCRMLGIKREEWDGFKSVYCDLWCEELREYIRNKHDRICFICGKTEDENGEKLSVHHTDYNKDCGCDGSECILVPLCRKCHAYTTFGDRDMWENLIIDMLKGEV